MSRKSCIDCVRKHLAQASVLLDEAQQGYPHHRWLAVGHLAEAEAKCLDEQPDFAAKIRACRLLVMKSEECSREASLESLLIEACVLAGEIPEEHTVVRSDSLFGAFFALREV